MPSLPHDFRLLVFRFLRSELLEGLALKFLKLFGCRKTEKRSNFLKGNAGKALPWGIVADILEIYKQCEVLSICGKREELKEGEKP